MASSIRQVATGASINVSSVTFASPVLADSVIAVVLIGWNGSTAPDMESGSGYDHLGSTTAIARNHAGTDRSAVRVFGKIAAGGETVIAREATGAIIGVTAIEIVDADLDNLTVISVDRQDLSSPALVDIGDLSGFGVAVMGIVTERHTDQENFEATGAPGTGWTEQFDLDNSGPFPSGPHHFVATAILDGPTLASEATITQSVGGQDIKDCAGVAVLFGVAGGTEGNAIIDFVGVPVEGFATLTVQFTNLSQGMPTDTEWLWDFGDGSTSTESDPLHSYSRIGIYTVSLTADSASGEIIVPPPGDPPFDASIAAFPGSGPATGPALAAMIADLDIDVIEIADGTYEEWFCFINVARPSSKPLLIRPAAGADVIWDGTGLDNDPPFRIGWSSLASYIKFDPAGTGGTFKIQNYVIGPAGLVMGRYTDHITFNSVIVRDCIGTDTLQSSHCVYLSTDTVHRSKNWTSDGWDVIGPVSRYLNGFHAYANPGCDGVSINDWTVSNLHRAAYLWSNSTGISMDGWNITDCDGTVDNDPNVAQGTVSDCTATDSGPLAPGSGFWRSGSLVDGGGNTAS